MSGTPARDSASSSIRSNLVSASKVVAQELILPDGAVDTYVLTSDANGKAAWEPIASEISTATSLSGTSPVSRLVRHGNLVILKGAFKVPFVTIPAETPLFSVPAALAPGSSARLGVGVATSIGAGNPAGQVALVDFGSGTSSNILVTNGSLDSGSAFTGTVAVDAMWFI